MIKEPVVRFKQDLSKDWVSPPGYEGLYEVSSDGEVWSLKHYKLLAENRNVVLSRRDQFGQIINKTFHTPFLIATCFVPNPENYRYIGYRDGDRKNFKKENLYWKKYSTHSTTNNGGVISEEFVDTVRELFKKKGGTVTLFHIKYYPNYSLFLIRRLIKDLVNAYCHLPEDTETERWKSIEGTYGHFYVSTSGRVWNAKRGVIIKTTSNGQNLIFSEHRKKTKTSPVIKKCFIVHMLVAKHFLRGYKKKEHDVVFKDGDHLNPQLYNLNFKLKSERGWNFRPIVINQYTK
jgi:hypothetical protein